jgi:hypothetical protein
MLLRRLSGYYNCISKLDIELKVMQFCLGVILSLSLAVDVYGGGGGQFIPDENCPVTIPASEVCDAPCATGEYCRITRTGTRCCRTQLIASTAQGIRTRRCSQMCVLPLKRPMPMPRPRPTQRVVRPNLPRPTRRPPRIGTGTPNQRDCPKTVPQPENGTATTITYFPQFSLYLYACNKGFILKGDRNVVCTNGQFDPSTCEIVPTGTEPPCRVNIPPREQCNIQCVGDEYCRITRTGIRCCRTTRISFRAQGGISVDRCSESCVLPPRQIPQPTPHAKKPTVISRITDGRTEEPILNLTEKPDRKTPQKSTATPKGCPMTETSPINGMVLTLAHTRQIAVYQYSCKEGYQLNCNRSVIVVVIIVVCINGQFLQKQPTCEPKPNSIDQTTCPGK